MTEQIKQTLRDSSKARWIALVILSFTMFAGYMFTEIISPMKPILERNYAWDSADFGTVTSAYAFLNVFLFMLVIVGILSRQIWYKNKYNSFSLNHDYWSFFKMVCL
jgi:predicted MFS family arabinose efflux permease